MGKISDFFQRQTWVITGIEESLTTHLGKQVPAAGE
jgi:hypothetical protein